jgi:CBS domain-containing protein
VQLPDAREFLRKTPPFEHLGGSGLLRAAAALSAETFPAGAAVIEPWQTPEYLYLVVRGTVDEVGPEGRVCAYEAGAGFDTRGLITGRSEHRFVARVETTCYALPKPLFLALSRSSPAFHKFYQEALAAHLQALVGVQQQREAAALLLARLGEARLHPPVFAAAGATLGEAVRLMQEHQTSALLVRDGPRTGIFTERDVREKLVLMRLPESTPLGEAARFHLYTLDRDDLVFDALMLMTRHSVRHLVVTRGERIEGVYEQADLLHHLSDSSLGIASRADHAETIEQLADAANALPGMLASLSERGVKPRYIVRMVTDLNRRLLRRVYELVMPAAWRDAACLIVMGSEGRGEQLFRTDQDNGLILPDDRPCDGLAEAAGAFSSALDRLGYPPCPGKVMVSNPFWCKPLAEFRRTIQQWVREPDGDAFLNFAILGDAAAAAGDARLLSALKQSMFSTSVAEGAFLGHFAKAVVAFPTPLSMFNRFVVTRRPPHADGIDLKKGGLFPIVHGIRSLALEGRIGETNTVLRIQALSAAAMLSESFSADLIEAFDYLSMLRLRQQLADWRQGRPCDNFIWVDGLSKLERGLLRDSLKLVKDFKKFVSSHFQLELVT